MYRVAELATFLYEDSYFHTAADGLFHILYITSNYREILLPNSVISCKWGTFVANGTMSGGGCVCGESGHVW